jgi:hypothetical protein
MQMRSGTRPDFNLRIRLSYNLPVEIYDVLVVLIYGHKDFYNHAVLGNQEFFMDILKRHAGSINLPELPFFKHPDFPKIFKARKLVYSYRPYISKFVLNRRTRIESIYLYFEGKNVDFEPELLFLFMDWINPYIHGHSPRRYHGWYRTVNDLHPVNVYSDRSVLNHVKKPS